MIATAIKSEGGSGSSRLYYGCLQPCSKKHTVLYALLLHAALLADHSAHYARWEQEPLACLVALLLDRDQRGRKRETGRERK